MARDPDDGHTARAPGAFFIDPKSTLTPAFCGAATWVIAKSLVGVLSVDESFVGIAALVVSALFAAAVVAQLTVRSLWLRGLYWVLNALIILTMGVGGSTLASIGDKPDSVVAPPAPADPPTRGPSPLPTPPPTRPERPPQPRREPTTVLDHADKVLRGVGKALTKP